MEFKFVKDIYDKGRYINLDHVVYVAKIEKAEEVFQLTGKTELDKCYVVYMTNGQTIVLKNMF